VSLNCLVKYYQSQHSLDTLARSKGSTSKGKEGNGKEHERREKKEKGKGREEKIIHSFLAEAYIRYCQ